MEEVIPRVSPYRTGPQRGLPGVKWKKNFTTEMPIPELIELARIAEANNRSRTQQFLIAIQEHLDRLAPGWRDRKAAWIESMREESSRSERERILRAELDDLRTALSGTMTTRRRREVMKRLRAVELELGAGEAIAS